MKQQLLEKKQILIEHLQSKIKALREQRNSLLNSQPQAKQPDSRVNINSYLAKQSSFSQKQIKKQPKHSPNSQLAQKNDNSATPIYSKADLMRHQRETKQKIQRLGDLYNKKKQLESIGIHQNNVGKINHLFSNSQSKKQIQKKMQQSKANKKKQDEKDRIIQQQLANAKKFLAESKNSKINRSFVPEKHFSKVFAGDQKKLNKITSLINKGTLSLVQKDEILWETFEALRQKKVIDKVVLKEILRQFLLSNIQICDKFYITKNEIMRDLQVYQTKQTNVLTYQQFYQFVKSVEITNLALKPNLKFKNKKQVKQQARAVVVQDRSKHKEYIKKEMESYLKKLYSYLDNKHEKVIQRTKLELALKKAMLFDAKKYKALTKKDIEQFGRTIERTRQKYKEKDYYKNLDMKYIGLEQILHLYKEPVSQTSEEIQQNNQNDPEGEERQNTAQADQNSNQNANDQEDFEMFKCQMKPELTQQDYKKYGWEEIEQCGQKFKSLKELDRHYKQIGNKYGNEIAWNGFEHYREDFSKFNQCIKELNIKNERQTKK